MSSAWQQILALDARYNAHRAPNDPTFRAVYIRRRSQLLKEFARKKSDSTVQKDYLQKRAMLLAARYSYVPSEGSTRSRSLSVRSGSQATLEGEPHDIIKRANQATSVLMRSELHEGYKFDSATCSFSHHTDSITRLRFAHDDSWRFAVSSMDHTVSICQIPEINAGTCLQPLIMKGHHEGVVDIVWSVSNDLLLSCSLDSTLHLWNPSNGDCIRVLEDNCAILCCLFQPINNNLVVTGNIRGCVQVLNISTGKYVKTGSCKVSGAAVCMCCDNTGRLLWVGDDKGTVMSFLMDPSLGKLVKGIKMCIADNSPVTSMCCRPYVNNNGKNEPLVLLNVATNALYVYSVVNSNGNLKPKRRLPIKHSRLTIHGSFCPLVSFRQGAFAVSGSEDGQVHLFDVDTVDRSTARDLHLKCSDCPIIDVTFNHDETFLVAGNSKGDITVWRRIKKTNSSGEELDLKDEDE